MIDKMTRQVNGSHGLNVTAIAFDSPGLPLLPGEYVTDGTYHYPVVASTKSQITIGTAAGETAAGLRATLADEATLTREDYFAPCDFDTLLSMLGMSDASDNDGMMAIIHKAAMAARSYGESIMGPIKARSKTVVLSLDEDVLYLRLPELRVESISEVKIYNDVIDAADYTLIQEQGRIYYGTIIGMQGVWPAGDEHITVTYSPGWTTVAFQLLTLFWQQTALIVAQMRPGQEMAHLSAILTPGGRERVFRDPIKLQDDLDQQWHRYVRPI